MRRTDGVRQLGDAIDLLSMLEQLVDGYSRREPVGEGVPWRGIKLTLSQVRVNINRARDTFTQDLALEDAFIQEPSARKPQKFVSSPLAGRIQKAPTTGRVREINDSMSEPESKEHREPAAAAQELPAAVGEM